MVISSKKVGQMGIGPTPNSSYRGWKKKVGTKERERERDVVCSEKARHGRRRKRESRVKERRSSAATAKCRRERSGMAGAISSAIGPHSVFVYGSLMADEVVHVLLTRVPPSSPALLPNFHRFSIKGRVYPAILPVENKTVSGKVITGITDEELVILDNFEDVEYVRRSVEISLLDTSEKMLAETYIWSDKDDPDLYGEWDFEEWKKLHMTGFLEMTKDFKEILEESDSTKTRVETYESFYKEDSSSDM